MKIRFFFIPILCISIIVSCNSKGDIAKIASLSEDFPVSQELDFTFVNQYDVIGAYKCTIQDSVLWHMKTDGTTMGYCYDLRTGKQLSPILTIGRANYEVPEDPGIKFVGDSVQFQYSNKLLSFSTQDIINNVPIGQRNYSLTTTPESIYTNRAVKLPNGSVICTIDPSEKYNEQCDNASIIVYNKDDIKVYNTIDYESFGIEKVKGTKDLSNPSLAKSVSTSYANGLIETRDNERALCSVFGQFIFYTFDIKEGQVLKEKRYTELKEQDSYNSTNDMSMMSWNIVSDDEHILCLVVGYFSEEDKEAKIYRKRLFSFDWDLNPIKMFDLPYDRSTYIISDDCKTIYQAKDVDEGVALYSA